MLNLLGVQIVEIFCIIDLIYWRKTRFSFLQKYATVECFREESGSPQGGRSEVEVGGERGREEGFRRGQEFTAEVDLWCSSTFELSCGAARVVSGESSHCVRAARRSRWTIESMDAAKCTAVFASRRHHVYTTEIHRGHGIFDVSAIYCRAVSGVSSFNNVNNSRFHMEKQQETVQSIRSIIWRVLFSSSAFPALCSTRCMSLFAKVEDAFGRKSLLASKAIQQIY